MSGKSIQLDSVTNEKKQAKLSAAYSLMSGYGVPIIDISPPQEVRHTPKMRFENFELMCDYAVSWANKLQYKENDMVPFIETGNTVAIVAEAFGCEIVWPEDSFPRALQRTDDIATAWEIRPKKMKDCKLISRTFEWIDYAQRMIGADVGYWTMDLQGPLSVVADIIGAENMIMSCMTHPDEVHHILRMVTDFSIELMERHLNQLEHPLFPGRNFPSIDEKIGVCVADDTPVVMLNPKLYEEFSLPYLREIGEAFGGLHIHSCGNYKHNLDSLLKLDCLKSIQVHGGQREFPLPANKDDDDAFNRARKKVCCFVDVNEVTLGDVYVDNPKKYYKDYLVPRLDNGHNHEGLIVMAYPSNENSVEYKDSFTWTRQQFVL